MAEIILHHYQPSPLSTDGYAFDPVAGEIVAFSASDVAIRRHDAEVGYVVGHPPRAGFRLAAA